MCKFEEDDVKMTFENCNLFKRSFTTKGIGYTFNNEMEEDLIKKEFRDEVLSPNKGRRPSFMKSTNPRHALTVMLDINAEEVEDGGWTDEDGNVHEPKAIALSIHNPQEPGDNRFYPLTSVTVPLGYSTTFLITPIVRKIDESGKALTELQRKCRLDEDTDELDIFNVYTRVACLFECKMKHSIKRCGCTPWNYPVNMNDKVIMFHSE